MTRESFIGNRRFKCNQVQRERLNDVGQLDQVGDRNDPYVPRRERHNQRGDPISEEFQNFISMVGVLELSGCILA